MSYRDRAGKPEDEDKRIGEPMPCRYCGAITPHETLRLFGARCLPCYRNYCEAPRVAPDTGSRVSGPKGWAWALRHREVTGERLPGPQQKAWREALRAELEQET